MKGLGKVTVVLGGCVVALIAAPARAVAFVLFAALAPGRWPLARITLAGMLAPAVLALVTRG